MHIRALIPAEYEWGEFATRNQDSMSLWFIGCEDGQPNDAKLSNETLDRLWQEWKNLPQDPNREEDDITGPDEAMGLFSIWLIEEHGYVFHDPAWGGIWHPEKDYEVHDVSPMDSPDGFLTG